MAAVGELSPVVCVQAACAVLGLRMASYYRQQRNEPAGGRVDQEGFEGFRHTLQNHQFLEGLRDYTERTELHLSRYHSSEAHRVSGQHAQGPAVYNRGARAGREHAYATISSIWALSPASVPQGVSWWIYVGLVLLVPPAPPAMLAEAVAPRYRRTPSGRLLAWARAIRSISQGRCRWSRAKWSAPA
jgi:hypothetical protein